MTKAPLPFPFDRGFTFVKAKPYDPVRCAGRQLVYEPKLDGHRVLVSRSPEGVLSIWSRGVSSVTGLPRDLLVEDHKQPGGSIPWVVNNIGDYLSNGDAVEAELYLPDGEATDVPTMLKDAAGRARLRAKAFDMPCADGGFLADLNQAMRRESLLATIDENHCTLLAMFSGPMTPPYSAAALDQWAAARNFEGWIIKDKDEPCTWWKYKRESVIDAIVLGTTDAKPGKYAGLVGALIVGVVLPDHLAEHADYEWELDGAMLQVKEIAQVSGMTDEQRYEITDAGDDVLGRVCEIKFQSVGSKARLRHPRFKRWRDDEKRPSECGHDQSATLVELVGAPSRRR